MKYLLPLLLLLTSHTFASRIDTILVHSSAMNKDIKCVVIQPTRAASFNTSQPTPSGTLSSTPPGTTALPPAGASSHPVIYLLHGWSGNYAQWPSTAPQLGKEADDLGIIFVCPDGGYDSWYFDSPIDPSVRYETFMTKELIPYIDTHYPTTADKNHRAITGLSMGGHGALYLAIRHKDLFGAAGATSGGVDFRPFPNNWGLRKDLGDTTTNKNNWDNNTVFTIADSLHNGDLKLIFDCGVNDFFLTVNRNLHQKLLDKKIDHDYTERPGGHNGAYWRNSIDYQVLFFWKYFRISPHASQPLHQ